MSKFPALARHSDGHLFRHRLRHSPQGKECMARHVDNLFRYRLRHSPQGEECMARHYVGHLLDTGSNTPPMVKAWEDMLVIYLDTGSNTVNFVNICLRILFLDYFIPGLFAGT